MVYKEQMTQVAQHAVKQLMVFNFKLIQNRYLMPSKREEKRNRKRKRKNES